MRHLRKQDDVKRTASDERAGPGNEAIARVHVHDVTYVHVHQPRPQATPRFFLHGYEIKSGSGLGTRLHVHNVTYKSSRAPPR